MSIPIKTLIAPNDPTGPANGVFVNGYSASWMWKSPVDVALCSYACNFQVFGWPENNYEPSPWSWHRIHGQRRFSDILDGTSNTAFVAEKRMVCGSGPLQQDPWSTNTFYNTWGSPLIDTAWPVFARIPVNNLAADDPNRQFSVPQVNPSPAQCQGWDSRPHGHSTGGTLVGMGDGSVRLVAASISQINWTRMVLFNDGAVVE